MKNYGGKIMKTEQKEKDPLDELFMDEHDSKLFNKGMAQGKREMLNKLKEQGKIENVKLMKENKFRYLTGEVQELKQSLKAVESAVKYWKNRADRFENKSIAVSEKIKEMKLTKKQKEKINKILSSGSREYNRDT